MFHTKRELTKLDKTERFSPHCVQLGPKSGPHLLVWGIIGWQGVGPLKRINGTLNALEYQQQVLNDVEEVTLVVTGRKPGTCIFQQDNAPPHRALSTQQYLTNKGVRTIEWPGNSPDLNPIEHVWSYVAKILDGFPLPRNAAELWESVQSAWARVPTPYVRDLIRSIPRRVHSVIKSKGGFTRY